MCNDEHICLLLEQIEIDIFNSDHRNIIDYENILNNSNAVFPEEHKRDIENALKELKQDKQDWEDYLAIKAQTLNDTGNEILVEDVAWTAVYG